MAIEQLIKNFNFSISQIGIFLKIPKKIIANISAISENNIISVEDAKVYKQLKGFQFALLTPKLFVNDQSSCTKMPARYQSLPTR
jgi:hypothetical protein